MDRPQLPPAGPLTGTERITVNQNGKAVRALISPGPKGDPGADSKVPGPQGLRGDKGDPAAVFLAQVDVTEKVTLAITLPSLRTLDVTVAGVLVTDRLAIYPVSLPAGYAIHNAVPVSAGKVRVTLTVPAVAINTTYVIPCAIFAVGR